MFFKRHIKSFFKICQRCMSNSITCNDQPELQFLSSTNLAAMPRGTGGRQSFNGIVATVFGSTGSVGRYIVNKLTKTGSQVIIPYRGDAHDCIFLRPCGDLGQMVFTFFNLKDENSIRKAIKYSNVVINLIGREYETRNFKFYDVHVKGAAKIAELCREMKVERLIHFSALNASEKPDCLYIKKPSEFLFSKWLGEQKVRDEFPNATIIRPADIFGNEDRFCRYYSHVWRRTGRHLGLWKKGKCTVKQPVYAEDVGKAVLNIVLDYSTKGKIYQAIGPSRYLLCELVDWMHRVMRKDEKIWGYKRYDLLDDPTFILKVLWTQKMCTGHPMANLTMTKIELEAHTDEVDNDLPTLKDLGVKLTHMEDIGPWILRPFRAYQYYDAELGEFDPPAPLVSISPTEEAELFKKPQPGVKTK